MTTRKSARFRVGRCFSPYPVHYSRAFAFSTILYPPHQQRSLRSACRRRRRDGLTLFRMSFRAGRTLPIRRRLVVHGGPVHEGHSTPRTVWFKPVSTFGLLLVTTFIRSSHTLVVPAHPLLLSAFVLADSASPRGSADRLPGGYVVPRASHQAVTGSACPGRERLMEQPVSSAHTFSSETETQATFRSHVHVESDVKLDLVHDCLRRSVKVVRLSDEPLAAFP
ncbi:hypothetical protein B0G80_1338 [Paraburkholderia sp. BL6669N2]|nr:hypothetical protein B0G80_1338 [Paraburkholderia sp. BL6669N2]